jgi:endoglucanase
MTLRITTRVAAVDEALRPHVRWTSLGISPMMVGEDSMPLLKALGLAAVSAALLQAPAPAQYVHTNGRQIVDASGKPLLLHGINLGNWMVTEGYMWHFEGGPQSEREIEEFVTEMLGPDGAADFWRSYRDTYISREDIHRIKQAGFDSIRIPIHWKFFTTPDAEGWKLLDRVIGWCRQEGLLVVIDLHAAQAGQTGANIDDSNGWPWLYTDAVAQQATSDLWKNIAHRYRDNPAVLGYDLLNEPLPHYPAMRQFDSKLEPLYKRFTAAIRTEDKHHAIILGGAKWDSDFTVFGPPFDANVIYQFHTYWTPPEQATVQKYIDFREKNNVPIWLGESGENQDEWIAQFARLLEKNDIGWAFWPYKKMDATSSPVTFPQPEHWAEIVAYAKLGRNLSDVEKRQAQRPGQAVIDRAFASLLENIQFAHETVNSGYIHALLPMSPR